MAWLQKYNFSHGGPLTGRMSPHGTLTGYIQDSIRINQHLYYFNPSAEPPLSWEGAFGASLGPQELTVYNDDSWEYNVDLGGIEVLKPEGAQYKAQLLWFKAAQYANGPTDVQGRSYIGIRGINIYKRVINNDDTITDTLLVDASGSPGINGYYGEVPSQLGEVISIYFTFSPAVSDNTSGFAFSCYTKAANQDNYNMGCLTWLSDATLMVAFDTDEIHFDEKEDPNEESDPPGPGSGGGGGGNGDHYLPNMGIPIPELPVEGAASPTWLTLYKMTGTQISEFGDELVTPNLWQAIKAWFTDPLDAIVGILLCPVDIPTTRTRTPSCGQYSWTNAYPVCSSEFYELDCGTIQLDPYWDSAFDMDPFTKLVLVLPYIGARTINADEVMGCTLGVKYHIDVCTGDCIAFVTKSASAGSIYGESPLQVIGQYNGNCGVRVPIGRVSHDSAIDGCLSLINSGIQAVGTVAGNSFGSPENIPASQIANQVSGATMSVVNGIKQRIERTGNIAAAGGYMAIQKPYIVRSIPRQVLPNNYKKLEGYPMQRGGTLSMYIGSGLNTVEAIELRGFMGYDSEQKEIIDLLQGGVII